MAAVPGSAGEGEPELEKMEWCCSCGTTPFAVSIYSDVQLSSFVCTALQNSCLFGGFA